MPDRILVRIEAELLPLIPTFLENRRSDVTAIAAALQAGDLREIMRLGHNMKGAGAGYGFDCISDLGAALERAALTGNGPAISEALEHLADYLDRLDVLPA